MGERKRQVCVAVVPVSTDSVVVSVGAVSVKVVFVNVVSRTVMVGSGMVGGAVTPVATAGTPADPREA